MTMKLNQGSIETNQHKHSAMTSVDDALIEKVWRDLDEQLPYEQVGRVVADVAFKYQNAKVKAFLPILIHKQAVAKLKEYL